MTKAHLGWWAGERYWQCTEHVFSDERSDVRGHQCGKTAKHDPDADGNPTKCKLHSKEGVAARKAKQDARWAETEAKWTRDRIAQKLTADAKEIVRRIADGHNDPRGLCADWVSRWDQNDAGAAVLNRPQGPEGDE